MYVMVKDVGEFRGYMDNWPIASFFLIVFNTFVAFFFVYAAD